MRYQAPERRKELLERDDRRDAPRRRGPQREASTRTRPRSRRSAEILRDALLKKAQEDVPKPADIPASEVSAYFDAHKADFHDPERRRVSAIVLGSSTVAAGIIKVLQGAGASHWGDLVRSKSLDPLAKANVPVDLAGDIGFVSPAGRFPRHQRAHPGRGARRRLHAREGGRRAARRRRLGRPVLRREAHGRRRSRTTERSRMPSAPSACKPRAGQDPRTSRPRCSTTCASSSR